MNRLKAIGDNIVGKACGIIATVYAGYCHVYCSNAFDLANQAADTTKGKLIALGEKVFPIGLVMSGIALAFTRDPKKFDIEKKIFIGCCIGYVLVKLANMTVLQDTIGELLGAGAGGQ